MLVRQHTCVVWVHLAHFVKCASGVGYGIPESMLPTYSAEISLRSIPASAIAAAMAVLPMSLEKKVREFQHERAQLVITKLCTTTFKMKVRPDGFALLPSDGNHALSRHIHRSLGA